MYLLLIAGFVHILPASLEAQNRDRCAITDVEFIELGLDSAIFSLSERRKIASWQCVAAEKQPVKFSSLPIPPQAQEYTIREISLSRWPEETLDDFKNRAAGLFEMLREHPEEFPKYARELSTDAARKKSGLLTPQTANQINAWGPQTILESPLKQIGQVSLDDNTVIIFKRESGD